MGLFLGVDMKYIKILITKPFIDKMSDTLMVLLEIFGKACMFYNVRLFLYAKLHVQMCLIIFGIRYVCKIGIRFVKEFDDTIRQNPFCWRILILRHKLRIKWECSLRKDFITFCMPCSSVFTIIFGNIQTAVIR